MKSISPEQWKVNYLTAMKAQDTIARHLGEAEETVRRLKDDYSAACKLRHAYLEVMECLGLGAEAAHAEEEARVWAQLHNTDLPPLSDQEGQGYVEDLYSQIVEEEG